jgi:LysM repeat protein
MPDNSDETARVLCIGGSWLKNRDPEAADLFYKALVRRNRKTALGMEAERIRWFPKLDAQGNLVPRQPSAPDSSNPPSPPQEAAPGPDPSHHPRPGQVYVIRSGDSLHWIARDVNAIDQSITLKELLEANPGLENARIRVGQRILIPAGKTNENPAPAHLWLH